MQFSIIRNNLGLFILIILVPSCGDNKAGSAGEPGSDTAVSVHKRNESNPTQASSTSRDTTITYSIEGLSAEGSELQAHYIRDTIREVTWNIYGETGQSEIKYVFLNKVVMAEEKNFVYEQSITEVNDKSDMKLKSRLNYVLDTSGKLISKIDDPDFVNVFGDMKAQVPFVLRK